MIKVYGKVRARDVVIWSGLLAVCGLVGAIDFTARCWDRARTVVGCR